MQWWVPWSCRDWPPHQRGSPLSLCCQAELITCTGSTASRRPSIAVVSRPSTAQPHLKHPSTTDHSSCLTALGSALTQPPAQPHSSRCPRAQLHRKLLQMKMLQTHVHKMRYGAPWMAAHSAFGCAGAICRCAKVLAQTLQLAYTQGPACAVPHAAVATSEGQRRRCSRRPGNSTRRTVVGAGNRRQARAARSLHRAVCWIIGRGVNRRREGAVSAVASALNARQTQRPLPFSFPCCNPATSGPSVAIASACVRLGMAGAG
jgi:hypothetical protein